MAPRTLLTTFLVVFSVGVGVACSQRQARPSTCVPPALEAARSIPFVVLPQGCRFTSGGRVQAPRVVESEAELSAHLQCESGAPNINWEASDLYLVNHHLSPAYGGGEVRDDGTTLTLVTRFRPNCPDDPRGMPIVVTRGFLVPKGATRTMMEASCSLPRDC